ncbi:hypothetical protein LRM40_12195 [Ideonella dechloratans]|jgi:hypothetical protein|uniref:hypothetical protein n=1 Tax=Ideonella dechloratans TaxID=36863 RepID=UPI001B8626AE|nr:hypothetical protein [Ideonella dechloratans]UFU09069.1 hypothetical protein LRM40_12195 [Ideonella dechloratans]
MLNRHRWSALALTAALAAWAPMSHAADVGVSISIGQPGLQGRIDIGRFYEPALIAPQPVIVQPAPVWAPVQPVYLWAPPAHRAHWARYCGQYGACGAPVYFVRDDWYQAHVVPVVRRAPPPPPVVYAPVPVYRGGPGPGYGYGPGYGRGWDDDHHHGHGHDRDGDRGGRW